MNREALIALRDAVKAGTWLLSRERSTMFYVHAWQAYNGSLDAAKALDAACPTRAVMDDATAKMILFGRDGARTWLLWKIEALIAETPE